MRALPNKYTFQLGNKLMPTDYQPVLATRFVLPFPVSGLSGKDVCLVSVIGLKI